MDVLSNTLSAFKVLLSNKLVFFIGLTESMLLSVLHIFIFIWSPTIKNLKSDVDFSYVFTILMMSLMTGGAAFRACYNYFDKNTLKVAKLIGLLTCIGIILIYINVDYNKTLIGFIIYEISVGLFYPTYSKLKSEYLPNNKIGTLTNIFKIPFNVLLIILLINTNKIFTIEGFIKLSLVISIALLLFQVVFFYNKGNEYLENKKKEEKSK